MIPRLLALLVFALAAPVVPASAQTPKAPAPQRSPADLAADEFYKLRNDAAAKQDQARFTRVLQAGLTYLEKHANHWRAADVVRDLGNYGSAVLRDKSLASLRAVYAAQLKYELVSVRYKEELSNEARAAFAAVDASAADAEVRENATRGNLEALREKIDALAQLPANSRFLAGRERSFGEILGATGGPAKAEEHYRRLAAGSDKAVADMARLELGLLELRREPLALSFTSLDGKEVDFAQLRGKVVALYFWSSGHAASVGSLDALRQVHGDWRKRGFELISVSLDKAEDRAKVEKVIKDSRITFPTHFDGAGVKTGFVAKLGVTGPGRLVVFDKKGLLQSNNLPVNQLDGAVQKLLPAK